MNPVGYIAVGERGYHAIFLAEAEAKAIEEAAKHHGHTKPVVLLENVVELVRATERAAYTRGLEDGRAAQCGSGAGVCGSDGPA